MTGLSLKPVTNPAQAVIATAMPRAANLTMQAYPYKRIGARRKRCAPMFVWGMWVDANYTYNTAAIFLMLSSRLANVLLRFVV